MPIRMRALAVSEDCFAVPGAVCAGRAFFLFPIRILHYDALWPPLLKVNAGVGNAVQVDKRRLAGVVRSIPLMNRDIKLDMKSFPAYD